MSQRGAKPKAKASKSKDRSKKTPVVNCLDCNEILDSDAHSIQCERCEKWKCLECLNWSLEQYQALSNMHSVHWFCDSCESKAVEAVLMDKTIEEKVAYFLQGVDNRISNLEMTMKSELAQINAKVDKLLREDPGGPVLSEQIRKEVKDEVLEMKDRDARKMNLIVHNLAESASEDQTQRSIEDKLSTTKLFEETLKIKEAGVLETYRLGKKEDGKTRLMKVVLESFSTKREILLNSKYLRNSDISTKNIYITPDLTQKDRLKSKLLRDELKKRREEGEEGLTIRRGEIVKIISAKK